MGCKGFKLLVVPYCMPCWKDKKDSDDSYQRRKLVKSSKCKSGQKKIRKSPSSSFSSFEEEYQPTVAEETRPLQAFGGQKDGFTTESTMDGDVFIMNMEDSNGKTDDNILTEDGNTTDNKPVAQNSYCISCSSPCVFSYCKECWKERKSWIPYKNRKLPQYVLILKKMWLLGPSKIDDNTTKQTFYKTWTAHMKRKKRRRKLKGRKVELCKRPQKKSEGLMEKCLLCNSRKINTAILHGSTSHKVTCYSCARKHWKYSPRCPICREIISSIKQLK